MTALLFADTNILIYSLDPANGEKQSSATDILRRGLAAGALITSPQSLNECYRVLTKKRRLIPKDEAREFVSSLFPSCVAPLGPATTESAWRIETDTGYSWWDCMLIAAALLAECEYFLSEDLTDGHAIDGMTVVNPFKHDYSELIS